jgi:hypothetical protein
MKKAGCIYIIFIALALCCSVVNGQVQLRATTDKNKILIGEPFTLTVEAYVPMGNEIIWPKTDTIPHFNILEIKDADTSTTIDGKKISQVIKLTSFDSGAWSIPQLQMKVEGKLFYTDTINVDVVYTGFNPNDDYRDIKDIEQVKNPYSKYVPWIIGFFTLASIGAIVYLLRRTPLTRNVPVTTKKLEPYEEAIAALDQLRSKQLPAKGEMKAFYSELNEILRAYMLRKLGIATMQQTNGELIGRLKTLQLPSETFSSLSNSLMVIDYVKFARYKPEPADAEQHFSVIRSAIQSLNNIS